MSISVVPVVITPTEVDIIKWIDKKCFPNDINSLNFDEVYWWFAYDGDKPVAYAGTIYFPNNNAFLSRAGVLPGWRGMGLHRRLVRARERAAKARGYTRTVTYTSPENVVSSNNLIRFGYKLYTPPYKWGLVNGLYWERVLVRDTSDDIQIDDLPTAS